VRLTIARADNATTLLDGTPVAPGATITFPAGTSQAVLQVRRQDSAAATTVSFILTDICGDWPSFVGGGPSAF